MKGPKRRKFKDNPYTLLYEDNTNKYYLLFKDAYNVINKIEVTHAIYDVFNCSELHDLKEMNEFDNHIEHLELSEESISLRSVNKPNSIDDEVIRKSSYDDLMNAINKLTDIQKRRVKKYYFHEITQQEIADDEGVNIRAVQYTLNEVLKKLKEILK